MRSTRQVTSLAFGMSILVGATALLAAALADDGKPKPDGGAAGKGAGAGKADPEVGVAPSPFGGRLGGRRNLVARGGGNMGTEAAVLAGEKWLARHQSEDGGWHTEKLSSACGGEKPCTSHSYEQFDVGQTGVALLALLGAGAGPTMEASTATAEDVLAGESVEYEDAVTHRKVFLPAVTKKGLDWLRSVQDDEGCFGQRTGEFMYNHAIATLAMAEAAGLSGAEEDRTSAQRAIDFIAAAQNPYRGWRYSVKPSDNDTSVTGWCVMATKAAQLAGLTVTANSFNGAKAWIDSVTDGVGQIGYNGLGKVDVVVRGKNEAWGPHPSMTAIGLACKLVIDGRGAKSLEKHADILAGDLPRWDEKRGASAVDFYYWYQGTLAIYQLDGPAGPRWRKWNEAMKPAIVAHQKVRADGCADGSWDPEADRWGFAGGRVYATAMNVLTLETYYRVALPAAKSVPAAKKK